MRPGMFWEVGCSVSLPAHGGCGMIRKMMAMNFPFSDGEISTCERGQVFGSLLAQAVSIFTSKSTAVDHAMFTNSTHASLRVPTLHSKAFFGDRPARMVQQCLCVSMIGFIDLFGGASETSPHEVIRFGEAVTSPLGHAEDNQVARNTLLIPMVYWLERTSP